MAMDGSRPQPDSGPSMRPDDSVARLDAVEDALRRAEDDLIAATALVWATIGCARATLAVADELRDTVRASSPRRRSAALAPALSSRQREILTLVASGGTNSEIGRRLDVSPHTVKDHVSSLYRKLGARNRAEAVRLAQDFGLLE
jgi:DNA-binding NarL/FixJ family response regulator